MKERSSSYAQALLLALLMLQACSSSESDRQVGTPAPVRMKFHQLKVEPQVHSSYPTYRRYHDGLAPQVVVIRVDGLERIGWEDRPAKASWIVRLPEQIYINGKSFITRWGWSGNWKGSDGPTPAVP